MFFKKNKDREILDVLSSIENYLKDDVNSLPEFNFECDGIQKDIKNKLDSICKILNQRNDEELQIYGELMLVAEKVQAGNFSDKIHHTNTSNSKLNYIAKTINLLVDNLKSSISQILITLDEFSNYNYMKKDVIYKNGTVGKKCVEILMFKDRVGKEIKTVNFTNFKQIEIKQAS